MAIIKCSECSKDISTKAEQCPHCGAKVKKSSNIVKYGLLFLFIFVVVIPILINNFSDNNSSNDNFSNDKSTIIKNNQKAKNICMKTDLMGKEFDDCLIENGYESIR